MLQGARWEACPRLGYRARELRQRAPSLHSVGERDGRTVFNGREQKRWCAAWQALCVCKDWSLRESRRDAVAIGHLGHRRLQQRDVSPTGLLIPEPDVDAVVNEEQNAEVGPPAG